MPPCIIGIDQGTTSSRALAIDVNGQVLAQHGKEFTQHYPQPGWCEHDPLEILSSVTACLAEVVAKVGAENVKAIGITNQRETTVAWDPATGQPLHNAVVWLDTRTASTVKTLTADGGADRFRPATGLPVSTYFSAVKMRWLLDNVPAVKDAAAAGKCAFGTIDSWLIYNLTGGAGKGVHVTDVSNASRYMLMNLATLDWDKDVCGAVGVPVGCLPRIVSNSEEYGSCVGVPGLEAVPICAALGDQHAALLGQGCLEVGDVKNTYGTGCFMLMNTGTAPVPSKAGLLTTLGYKLGKDAPATYALEGSIACAGRTIQWLRDNMGIISSAPEAETLALSVPDAGGVTFVPAFSGLFAPYWRDDARAVVVGMSLHTTKAHVARAAIESVALQTMDVMHAMQADSGQSLTKLAVDGGMTANGLLMQLQADLLGISVNRARMTEATAFGAAFAAGLAVGFWPDVTKIKELHGSYGVDAFASKMDADTRGTFEKRWADAIQRTYGLANL